MATTIGATNTTAAVAKRFVRAIAELTRLVGAVLAEQHDEWAEGRRYLGIDVLARAQAVTTTHTTTDTALPELEAAAA